MLLVTALLLLAACTSRFEPDKLLLADNVSYQLQRVPPNWPARSLTQLLTVTGNGETHSLLTQLEIGEGELRFVALTPEGVSLFSLVYLSTGEIALEKYLPLGDLYPEYVIADLQLALWPIDDVNQGLVGATLSEQSTGRVLMRANTPLITVKQANQITTLTNHARGYTVTIQTIE